MELGTAWLGLGSRKTCFGEGEGEGGLPPCFSFHTPYASYRNSPPSTSPCFKPGLILSLLHVCATRFLVFLPPVLLSSNLLPTSLQDLPETQISSHNLPLCPLCRHATPALLSLLPSHELPGHQVWKTTLFPNARGPSCASTL